MSYDLDAETLTAIAEYDSRKPIRIGDGHHVTEVAGSLAGIGFDEIGVYESLLDASYNDLEEGQQVVVEPFNGRGQPYEMTVEAVSDAAVRGALDPEEREAFYTGDAVVYGPDHSDNQYDWNRIDDRIQHRNIGKSGFLPKDTRVHIRSPVNPEDIDADLAAIGEQMAQFRQRDDYTITP